jgi:putative ABC transport system permease protein
VVFLGTFLAGTFLASIYPAMILSSIHPIKVLRGPHYTIRGNRTLQQGLVFFQFSVALLLVAGTGAVYYQVESMRNQSMGMDMDQVLVIHSPRSMIGNPERALYFRQFRDFLEPDPQIVSIASGGCLPGEPFLYHAEDVHAEGQNTEINWSFDIASVDERYLLTLDMKLLAGRNFEDRPGEERSVILNETGIRVLGFQDSGQAVGQFLRINQGAPREIIGVVEDAHFEGLHTTIKPLLLRNGHDYEFGFFLAKINAEDLRNTLERIESQWRTTYPKDPLEFFFLDQFFDRQYNNEQSFGQIFGAFSLLAIFISGIGLYGLISFTTSRKSKEIGIRKVMGANVLSIVRLLTGHILKLILLAGLISIPLAYWVIGKWLDTFAYRFEPAIWMYLIPLFLILITSLLAVISQTLKSALSNPVDAIAEE